jgi:hypothetical protein
MALAVAAEATIKVTAGQGGGMAFAALPSYTNVPCSRRKRPTGSGPKSSRGFMRAHGVHTFACDKTLSSIRSP